MPSLIAVGTFAFEVLQLAEGQESTLAGALLHFSAAAAAAGLPPSVVAHCPDADAAALRTVLNSVGVETRGLESVEGQLAEFVLGYDATEQLIDDEFEVSLATTRSGLSTADLAVREARNFEQPWIHICPDVPGAFHQLCVDDRARVLGRSAQIHESMLRMNLDSIRVAVAGVDVLFSTEREFRHLIGAEAGVEEIAKLRSLTEADCLVTSRDGVRAITGEHVSNYRCAPVVAMDPTGAGDSFAGGFLATWLKGGTQRESVAIGMLCALACVTDVGAQRLLRVAEEHPHGPLSRAQGSS